jgi:hypothetical protein
MGMCNEFSWMGIEYSAQGWHACGYAIMKLGFTEK